MLKKLLLLLIVTLFILPSTVFAETPKKVNCYSGGAYWDRDLGFCVQIKKGKNESTNMKAVEKNFTTFAYTIVYLSTGLALIMIVYSGFQYTMSEGDAFKIQEAKTSMLRAGIGMLIAFSTYNILGLFDAFRNL
ncbi:hypothetical protein ABEY63_25630 [Priestia aryabhattai]|uniref:hypothetical protein n=1 Tax=Priestia aryabhattai TaxID=412384 RepID=UPI003D2A3850